MRRGRKPKDIDDYISWYPAPVARRLERVRRTIHRVARGAEEKISYDIPTIAIDGRYLLYFAAFADHLSVYPAPRGAPEFADELKSYAGGKGTLRIQHDQPVPYDLIARIARHHLDRIRAKRKPSTKKAAPKKPGTKKASTKKAPKKPGAERAPKKPGSKAATKKSASRTQRP